MVLNVDINTDGFTTAWDEVMATLSKALEKASIFRGAAYLEDLKTAAGVAKRSLMSFDKINRLTAKSGSKSKQNTNIFQDFVDAVKGKGEVSGPMGVLVNLMNDLGIELRDAEYYGKLFSENMKNMPSTMRTALISVTDMLWSMGLFPEAFQVAEESLQELERRTMQTSVKVLTLPTRLQEATNALRKGYADFPQWLESTLLTPIQAVLRGISPAAEDAISDTQSMLSRAAESCKNTLTATWGEVLSIFGRTDGMFTELTGGVLSGVRSAINRVISGINQVLVEPFTGLNNAFSKLKSFKIGDLQPFKNLNFSLSMPKIPLLATGAVLPANKPFLAMVGDQKHGTNIEAPLATIQQAVAQVMAENLEAEVAGHNATIAVLRQILEAVLGIHLDEDAIGRAALRYQQHHNMMTGGF